MFALNLTIALVAFFTELQGCGGSHRCLLWRFVPAANVQSDRFQVGDCIHWIRVFLHFHPEVSLILTGFSLPTCPDNPALVLVNTRSHPLFQEDI